MFLDGTAFWPGFRPVGGRASRRASSGSGACFLLWGEPPMLQKADVLVIDAPRGAAFALEAYRPQHDRTHLICRWPDENSSAFARRVFRQLNKVKSGAHLAAMTLVLGG